MFNSKSQDGVSDAAHSASRATPAATNARTFAAHAAASDTNCSIINEWLIMRGDLESQGDILIKGKVQGNIQCKMLIIDAEAVVEGAIFADDIVVRGTTRGIIQARRVRIEKTANIDSEIYHETFSAEEGARVKGSMRSFDEYAADNAAAAPHADKDAATGGSLYHLLDKARSAHVAAAR
jgi:cytoskeletal protein CcmA (bactofilin family)